MTVARTYMTLSFSLPSGDTAIGQPTGRTGARVASKIVLRKVAERSRTREETSSKS
jgi:hypothetical protein